MNDLHAVEFFHLRTPLFPFQKAWSLFELSEDEIVIRIKEELKKPFLRELICIASPSLFEKIDDFILNETVNDRDLISFLSYYIRACTRCTPFGIAAGTSVGKVGERNEIVLDSIANYKRHVRLDLDLLWNLGIKISNDGNTNLLYYPNNTIHQKSSRMSFVKYNLNKDKRKYQLVNVENSEYLDFIIKTSENGATLFEMASNLAEGKEVEFDDAVSFVNKLIEEQVLLSVLEPRVTGREYMYEFTEILKKYPGFEKTSTHLDKAISEIQKLNSQPVATQLDSYNYIKQAFKPLVLDYKTDLPVQIDMIKPVKNNMINQNIVVEVKRVIRFLCRYKPTIKNAKLEKFKTAFYERYGDAEVPLLEALDPESGLGYPVGINKESYYSQILEGVNLPEASASSISLSAWEEDALQRYASAISSGEREIRLTDKELQNAKERRLPGFIYATFSVLAKSDDEIEKGNFFLSFEAVEGPSGANLLTRFCHADKDLSKKVKTLIEHEDAAEKEAILAEIVHVSSEGVGNIVQRPDFRKYEIPILVRPGVDNEHTITLDELMISIRYGRCYLRSKRMNKQVKPRLTNAHDYTHQSLMYYHFLCDVHYEDVARGLYWSWGPTMSKFDFLPRVTYGKAILSKARWMLSSSQLPINIKNDISDNTWFETIQNFRKKKMVPQKVSISFGGDNTLLLDLTNNTCLKILLKRLKQTGYVFMEENLVSDQTCFVQSEEGVFSNEFVLIFENKLSAQEEAPKIVSSKIFNKKYLKRHTSTSEWLYAKIYCGYNTADHLLKNLINPLATELLNDEIISQWHFVRFGDPDFHLRIRFKCLGNMSFSTIMKELEKRSYEYLEESLIYKIQYDTFEPELMRYGTYNIENSLDLFFYDSVATVNILSLLDASSEGEYLRGMFAMKSIDALLDDLKYGLSEKRDLMRNLSNSFAYEFGVNHDTKRQLAKKYREYRTNINAILDNGNNGQFKPYFDILNEKSRLLHPVASNIIHLNKKELLEHDIQTITGDYIHMLMNRFMMTQQRLQEMIIYDMLFQHYKSKIALQKYSIN